jgi:hypothetical protein
MKKIPMLERFAAQSLLDYEGELIFSKEKFAQLIVRECISTLEEKIHRSIDNEGDEIWADLILKEHFGVEL